ncbi:DUF6328 family protein [Arthrobacter zhangbolii]|uniref:DUF6328 family protein n=1 Tax=Arthrobacter zhangbolii TaxID=2886936 RepID=A0A9X1MBA8_9MICC|nr:DUF6328 family protein [Arthrobacter zhangbolii]MCC3273982.1 DUF6328 family protein [Arthrobacter zhangbolii]UON91288.1 DUF6328 family protein [Arthrobacter zhangbolii]
MGHTPAARDPDRGETLLQKLDRNWTDLLQELRVLQTGIQILTGFLLTLPFQQRFAELTRVQVAIYLCLVVLSVLVTAVLISTVVMHRTFFRQGIKRDLVRSSDVLLRATLVLVGLILIGTIGLIFDIVLSGMAGAVAALAMGAAVGLLWLLLPLRLRRRALRNRNRNHSRQSAIRRQPKGGHPQRGARPSDGGGGNGRS